MVFRLVSLQEYLLNMRFLVDKTCRYLKRMLIFTNVVCCQLVLKKKQNKFVSCKLTGQKICIIISSDIFNIDNIYS